ncbi:MAG: hypothetical protein LBG09_01465 [Puniceicoccales bacterium]|jgi:hypothetical protein|nr:hypothetical protein [Puniceicoccales bacterium]
MAFEIDGTNYKAFEFKSFDVAHSKVKAEGKSELSAIWAGICGLFGHKSGKLKKLTGNMGQAPQTSGATLGDRSGISATPEEINKSRPPSKFSAPTPESKPSEQTVTTETITAAASISDEQRAAKTAQLQTLMTDTFSAFDSSTGPEKVSDALGTAANLIQAGADPTVTDSEGQTLLHFAVGSRGERDLNNLIGAAKESNQLPKLLGALALQSAQEEGGYAPMDTALTSNANDRKLESLLGAIEETGQFDVLAQALQTNNGAGIPLDRILQSQRMRPKLQAFLNEHQGQEALNPIREALRENQEKMDTFAQKIFDAVNSESVDKLPTLNEVKALKAQGLHLKMEVEVKFSAEEEAQKENVDSLLGMGIGVTKGNTEMQKRLQEIQKALK